MQNTRQIHFATKKKESDYLTHQRVQKYLPELKPPKTPCFLWSLQRTLQKKAYPLRKVIQKVLVNLPF
ncbi:hypothetical protein EFB08_07435 [Rufibacter latericius]|uniref:Uncharacterized protein n=1 Tax=Rufibacter latericius TaxID=2487040 RepID=A0A3M9MWH2_9BACT|nr:hypothetical protein EFB08_07435 [Rufibacter latericius]